MAHGTLFIVTAPSGGGKTSILKRILVAVPNISFSVSHTTRPPRAGEQEGIDYYFIDREGFEKMRDAGDFLEWAEVHGNLYGTSRSAVTDRLETGQDIILDIDVQGAGQVKARLSESRAVFILPPSWQELEKRLAGRGTDTSETISLRLSNARKEILHMEWFDHIIINDDIDQAVDLLKSIILAERSRGRRALDGSPLDLSVFTDHAGA